jgi:hypothetical protein
VGKGGDFVEWKPSKADVALPRLKPPAPGEASWSEVYEARVLELAGLPPLSAWSSEDAFLIPGSTWNQPGFFAALRACAERPRVVGFIHDMIQVERPDFVGEHVKGHFRVWATDVACNCAEIVCISRHTAQGMQRFVAEMATGGTSPLVRAIKFGNKDRRPRQRGGRGRPVKSFPQACKRGPGGSSGSARWTGART